MIDMPPDIGCLFVFVGTIALVVPNQHTSVTEIYLVLILLTRANRQIGGMHSGMCIPVIWSWEFTGEEISRAVGISYLLQAATWAIVWSF